MDSISAVQQSFQQMAALLKFISDEQFNITEKIAKTTVELQVDGVTKEPFKGEQIDITV